jgi:hypothetical protein
MGFPQHLGTNKKSQELMLLAQRSSENSDWLGSMIAYSELHSVHANIGDLVMMTEAKRLAGLLDVAGFPNQLSVKDIVSKLGATGGEALLSKAALFKESLSDDDISVLLELSSESHLLRQSLGNRILLDSDTRLESSPFFHRAQVFNIADANAEERAVCFESYNVEVPSIEVASSATPVVVSPRAMCIQTVEVIGLKEIHFVVGSELFKLDGHLFVDGGTSSDAQFRNPQDDGNLLAVSQDEVIYSNFEISDTLRVDEILYMAYPTTEAWGEWFTCVLCRLAVFSECHPRRTMNVAILDSVPDAFEKIAQVLFPNFTFIRFPKGKNLIVRNAYIVPSWHSMNTREYWSMEGDTLRLQLEPQVTGLLRKCIDRAVPYDDDNPRRIFLNRSGARYRLGVSESILELLAEKHGYQSVNMGALSFRDQVNISRCAAKAFGQCGSNWDLVATTANAGHTSFIVHHDRPHEWQGVSWVYKHFSGALPKFVLGGRRIPSIGYGPEAYHQSVELSKENIEFLDEQLGSASSG